MKRNKRGREGDRIGKETEREGDGWRGQNRKGGWEKKKGKDGGEFV